MLKTILVALMSALLANNSGDNSTAKFSPKNQDGPTGIQQKLIVESGSAALNVDLNRLNGTGSRSQMHTLRFGLEPNSFFTILVFNDELRGTEAGTLGIIPQNAANLPAALNASYNQLVIESLAFGEAFELVVRDSKSGFTFFNVEGQLLDYDAKQKVLTVKEGRLLLSKEFATKLGSPAKAGTVIGEISMTATMRPIEVLQVVDGEVKSSEMPTVPVPSLPNLVPGPDVIVGQLSGLAQFGSSSGTQVGLAVATDSCNAGSEPLHWFALPANDHPVIPQNLYRMSGGATNTDRFEQIGQSNVKHAFTALQENVCNFGCASSGTGTLLGAGCSDPYSASLNSGSSGNSLGSRAWINPFTGAYPRGDSATPPNTHTGHSHTGPSHRILVEMADLNTTLNPGATYYAEAQYVTPHEYVWCQANPGQCNMNNNASFRQFTVSGTTSFTFAAVGSTIQTKPAITNWTGATVNAFQPDSANDGIGFIGSKVTNPSPGVWHYEYAVYNENLDRAIQSFSVPISAGTTVSNTGFHAPPQHPGWTADGTVGNAGYSSTPWSPTQSANAITWASETLAQNPNANAIRWGTLYNFRFDSNRPPATANATVGFYKTGAPITVQIQAPSLPAISINDVSVTEGNGGTTMANFTVTLSSASTDTVSVQWATANGSAAGGSDYVTNSGTVNFTPGQVTQPISVTVNGDTLEEFNETFLVNLTNPVNATISDNQGVGTITNDDVQATLPAGFSETQISGLSNPTAFAIHPDGRIFVCEQAGTLRVVKNGALLPTPFTTITVNFPAGTERGLLGVAFDPNYATNHFVYVYYTAPTPTIHNRVSRFTANIANEDVAVGGSEVAILDLENLGATNHNGGAIHFGPDGKLYVAVGENAVSSNAQSLSNRLGKMLRINSDGTIPSDNPTTFPNIAGSTTGLNQAIWAVGLRNPFTFNFQSGTGRLHINDVGQNTWEEINNGIVGSNYGWPTCEGSCGAANMTNPIYQYANDASTCALAGGDFYNPTTVTFPAQYIGQYFFSDLCAGWMKTIDPLSPPATGTAPSFVTGINQPVDIHVANDGSLYYLARGTGSLFQIQYFGIPQLAINDVTVTEGNSGTTTANFTVTMSPASSQTVTVNYATGNNTATAGSDYTTASGMVSFAPGQTSRPVSVFVSGDTTNEADETFNVNLTSPVNASIGDPQGVGTIANDDPVPSMSINDVTVTEGNSGTTAATFTVSLSNQSSQTITVNYATADNSASSTSDYATASGTVTINPNTSSQTFTVNVNGDTLTELNESFFVNLSSPTNATISDNQGIGTITNDDPEPSVSINDVTVTEGNSGTTTAVFTVSLSNPSSQTITVNYATADNSATVANSDYVSTSGTLTFDPTQLTKQVNVSVNGDVAVETDETFFVNLSLPSNSILGDSQGQGTITNDDSPGTPGISISDVSVTEGNGGTTTAGFTVSLSASSSQTVTVNYTTADNTATAGSDYQTASGQVSFAPGQTSQPVNVTVNGDTTFESNETFFVNLSGAVNASISDNQGIGTINNDDSQPTISINDVTVTEGNAGTTAATFTVSLSNASSQTITVGYATAAGSATAGTDYVTTSGTLTFTPTQTSQPISVTVNGDNLNEINETFLVNLSSPSNATISDSQGQGTITDDDPQPSISINDVTVTEGNAGTTTAAFTVSLSAASGQAVSVNYATANGTATAGSDYVTANGTVNFTAGQTSQPVSITVNGDVLNEPDENFFVNLSVASNATISDNQGQGTINNDDAQPSISIDDVAVTEGNGGTTTATFTVSLSAASGQAVSVNYATANGTATAGSDYVSTNGSVNFTPGQTSQPVSITVNGDVLNEPDEIFQVNISGASNATISDNQGIGTISNDDAQPALSINDVTVMEGNSGTTTATFTVSLSAVSGQAVSVNYATANGTATAGSDYVTANGTVNFTAGQTSQPVSITVNGDLLNEANETFVVNLSGASNATISDNQGQGTITDDDAQPSISINDVTVTEGNAGTTTAAFTVSLSAASGQAVSVNYATANGTATAGTDYVTASGTLNFTAGQTSQPVSITVNGDLLNETNETFLVNLSGASNASISDNQGQGTITDDDAQPSLSINDVTIVEGNAGTSTANFTVSLSAASGQAVSVNYSTANGTASSTSDYDSATGTLNFTAGQTSQPISVTINGDLSNEANETFFVNLSGATNASISDNQGLGTINDDDSQPTLSINDVAVTEGNAGTVNATFTVSLSPASGQTVTVQYATANGTASAADYSGSSGTLTFTAGQTSQPVTVAVNGDLLNETNETFFVNLSNPSNAIIGDNQGLGTITDDDAQPSLSINDVSLNEGNAGTTSATFTVSLSAASGQTVMVNYSTADGTASSASDYSAAGDSLAFAPGDLSKSVSVTVNGDTAFEANETFFVDLSNAANASISDNQGLGTILNDDQAPPSFQFSQSNFNQPESNQSLLITVVRSGDPTPAASVDFQTVDSGDRIDCSAVNGIATQRCDYLSSNGTLSFAANETQKTFRIITYNDLYPDGTETINLSLSNPSAGASLGAQNTATITILDDDSGTPASNPIDGAQFFVRQHYYDFLQRVPDQNGENFWVQQITACGSDPVCIHNKRLSTSDAFFFEPEYQQTAAYIVRLYRIAFGNDQPFRNPDSSDLVEAKKIINYSVFSKDRARVVGGSNLAQAQLDFANLFVQRAEFVNKYPVSLGGPEFVDAVLATINNDLGVNLSSQRDGLITLFNAGGRGNVMYRLADDNVNNPINNRAVIDAEYNRTFVFTEYAGYLRRNADIGGFKFWLGQVNAHPLRDVDTQHAMVCAFITSQEYQQRFSSVVTRNNTSCQ